MRTNSLAGQVSLFGPDMVSGKTSPARSPAEETPRPGKRTRGQTSGRSWRRSSRLRNQTFMLLDLRVGAGNLLGPYWENDPPWLGPPGTLDTSACPKGAAESSLWRILQDTVPSKYYLSKTACLGILRRAAERGKPLPAELERALNIQAGISRAFSDGAPAPLAFHINQRDETIDLGETAGAIIATQNIQMQTYVSQPPMAFATNQRDEVRDLHDIVGALAAQPGMRQQTFIAAFSSGAGAAAGSIAYSDHCAPTLKGTASSNMASSVLCLNDQGGKMMDFSEDVSGTLRAQEHGHQPLVIASQQGGAERGIQPALFENHGIDARYKGPLPVAPTLPARAGTGGNNLSLIIQPQLGQKVFSRQRVDVFMENGVVGTQSARQHKDATDLILDVAGLDCRNGKENGDLCGTLQIGTSGSSLNSIHPVRLGQMIRRLTPLECERLQGYPDGWTELPEASDSARYRALGNSVAVPCVEYLIGGIAKAMRCGIDFSRLRVDLITMDAA